MERVVNAKIRAMTSRLAAVVMVLTFGAIGLAFAIAVNRIDDLPIQLLLSMLYIGAILGITWRLQRRA